MKPDKTSQRLRILQTLKLARSRGADSLWLAKASLRYGSRLHELRKQGYKIETRRMSNGLFRYILSGKDW
jgi:hypothetical protein